MRGCGTPAPHAGWAHGRRGLPEQPGSSRGGGCQCGRGSQGRGASSNTRCQAGGARPGPANAAPAPGQARHGGRLVPGSGHKRGARPCVLTPRRGARQQGAGSGALAGPRRPGLASRLARPAAGPVSPPGCRRGGLGAGGGGSLRAPTAAWGVGPGPLIASADQAGRGRSQECGCGSGGSRRAGSRTGADRSQPVISGAALAAAALCGPAPLAAPAPSSHKGPLCAPPAPRGAAASAPLRSPPPRPPGTAGAPGPGAGRGGGTAAARVPGGTGRWWRNPGHRRSPAAAGRPASPTCAPGPGCGGGGRGPIRRGAGSPGQAGSRRHSAGLARAAEPLPAGCPAVPAR
ncbi:spidroin-2-like [Falco peregrinus]|uniref:spidroin-2-like n=1 Tax=Falco peregrinus TaxID=8954 RepID=UPI00247AA408|nr:spidroin-2-like [Falco peregrinus]